MVTACLGEVATSCFGYLRRGVCLLNFCFGESDCVLCTSFGCTLGMRNLYVFGFKNNAENGPTGRIDVGGHDFGRDKNDEAEG